VSDGGTGGSLRIEAPARVWDLTLRKRGRLLCGLLAGTRIARWSCEDGKLLGDAAYQGPTLTAGAEAPEGDRLAVGTVEPAVRVLDAATLAPVATMQAPPSRCGDLAYSADGAMLAGFFGRRRLELRVWAVASGAQIASFTDVAQEPAGIAFRPGGRLAAVSLLTGDILLLDLGASRLVRTLSDARMACEGIAFSDDGSALIAASYDGTLLAWDTREWRVRRLEGIPGTRALAVSPDGARAVVTRNSFNPPDTPAELRLVDLRSGRTEARRTAGIAGLSAVAFVESGQARVALARGTSIELLTLG